MRRSSRKAFGPILDEWRRYSVTLGRMVKVIAPDTTYTGKAEDIDEEGALFGAPRKWACGAGPSR